MTLKKKDFIEINYTGMVKEDGIVFDTTNKEKAEENGIYNPQAEYRPVVIVLGEGHILKGIDKNIEGKEPGSYKFELQPEEAFGKKDPKLIQLISTSKFRAQNITPMPGLQVNIDGAMGIVKTVSGGRTIVDFNHPLSGKILVYDIKVNKVVTDTAEKVKALVKIMLNEKEPDVRVKEGKADIRTKADLPKELQKKLGEEIKDLAGIKEVSFSIVKGTPE